MEGFCLFGAPASKGLTALEGSTTGLGPIKSSKAEKFFVTGAFPVTASTDVSTTGSGSGTGSGFGGATLMKGNGTGWLWLKNPF